MRTEFVNLEGSMSTLMYKPPLVATSRNHSLDPTCVFHVQYAEVINGDLGLDMQLTRKAAFLPPKLPIVSNLLEPLVEDVMQEAIDSWDQPLDRFMTASFHVTAPARCQLCDLLHRGIRRTFDLPSCL
jgi:hypothetical protein